MRIPLEIVNMDLAKDSDVRIERIFQLLCAMVEKEAEAEFGKKIGSLSLRIDSEVRMVQKNVLLSRPMITRMRAKVRWASFAERRNRTMQQKLLAYSDA